jgi:hypothetical protein
MSIVIGQSSRAEHLRMAIDLARAVAAKGDAAEAKRAMIRIKDYQDELSWLRRSM